MDDDLRGLIVMGMTFVTTDTQHECYFYHGSRLPLLHALYLLCGAGAVFVAALDDLQQILAGVFGQLIESHVVDDEQVGFEVRTALNKSGRRHLPVWSITGAPWPKSTCICSPGGLSTRRNGSAIPGASWRTKRLADS